MITLRDYQERAACSVLDHFQNVTSTLGVAATGCGKTTIFTEVIRRMQPMRAIVIAHREELIFQARDRIESQAGLGCEIEMADMVASTSLFHRMPVVAATVQTLVSGRKQRRLERFDPMEFGLLVIDEFHHATADTYKVCIDHFKRNPNLKILGVTATPDRADEEALGQIAESVAFEFDILDAIHQGWLCPVNQQFVSIEGLDFSGMRTTAGDLNGADLAAVMEQEKNLHGMCGAAIEIIGDKQAIVFTVTVKHAELACNILNRHKPNCAEWICGKTAKEKRRDIMKKFGDGRLQVLCNVGCITEGVDVPAAEICIMGRPTKSRSLYAQMAGRILRPLPGLVDQFATADLRKEAIAASAKPASLLVDFVGNSGRHKLMTSADILGGRVSEEAISLAIKEAKEKGGQVRMTDELEAAFEKLKKEADERRKMEEAAKARLLARVKYNARNVNPFDIFDLTPRATTPHEDGKTLSVKQRALLVKQGIDPDSMPYSQARQLLDHQFQRWSENLCSLKQAALLKRYGVEHAEKISRERAKAMIDQLAQNRWKKPDAWNAPDPAPQMASTNEYESDNEPF